MSYEWPQKDYDRLPEPVQQGRALLQDWFEAMERGDVERRQPDPLYEPEIAAEVADRVVQSIEAQFAHELKMWASTTNAGGYTAGPGFGRLKTPQRIALAQQLRTIVKRDQKQEQEWPPDAGA